MTTPALDHLLRLAGPPLGPSAGGEVPAPGRGGQELRALLSARNGFFAFHSALHVFGHGQGVPADAVAWNAAGSWAAAYDGRADGLWCFAEDAFGCQFALRDGAVVGFDPETGDIEVVASDLEGWAAALLDDLEVRTGHPVAYAWQQQHGPLPTTCRLVPTIPFVLGGEFDVGNVHALDRLQGMELRASIARQIRDLPDGAPITLRVEG